MKMTKLIDKVLDQIKKDVLNDDYTAIEELITNINVKNLQSYLPE